MQHRQRGRSRSHLIQSLIQIVDPIVYVVDFRRIQTYLLADRVQFRPVHRVRTPRSYPSSRDIRDGAFFPFIPHAHRPHGSGTGNITVGRTRTRNFNRRGSHDLPGLGAIAQGDGVPDRCLGGIADGDAVSAVTAA